MAKKTNILCVITDDHGAWALGCAGAPYLQTPTLDRLAANGVRFDNCFCTSPVCSPARASIFTGKIPSQHGIHDFLCRGHLNASVLSDEFREGCAMPEEERPWYFNNIYKLHDDTAVYYLKNNKTFTEVLAENGYECGISGKWHMGDSATPQAGFTYWWTTSCGAENYMHPLVYEDGKMVLKHNQYVTDLITDNAIKFLDQRDEEKPFYLSVHYNAPHFPWAAINHPEEFNCIYRDCDFAEMPNPPYHPWSPFYGVTLEEWNSKPHNDPRFCNCKYGPAEPEGHHKENLAGYFTALTAMDTSLNRLLKKLERDGLLENTLIIFTADNGMNMGHHGIWGKGNGTYPVNMYDTSVKVPCIFSYPGVIEGGKVNHEMVCHYDFYETILDFAGIDFEKPDDMPGVSFAPILRGEKEHVRDSVVAFDEYGPCRMIRNQEWKLILRYPDGPNELYHLAVDPDEETNLYGDPAYAPIQADLAAQMDQWFDKYVDPALDGSVENVVGAGQIDSHSFRMKKPGF